MVRLNGKRTFTIAIVLVTMAFFVLAMASRIRNAATIGRLEAELEAKDRTIDVLTAVLYPDPKRFPFPVVEGDIRITSQYGIRVSPVNHKMSDHAGLDIYSYAPQARVQSIADGEVIDSWPPPGGGYRGHPTYGGMVRIRHEDGTDALYAHLSAKYVKEGQRVAQGDVIGREGQTGSATGEHLHFELRIRGILVNPYLWVNMPPMEEME